MYLKQAFQPSSKTFEELGSGKISALPKRKRDDGDMYQCRIVSCTLNLKSSDHGCEIKHEISKPSLYGAVDVFQFEDGKEVSSVYGRLADMCPSSQ
jgi:hypothetical protein